MIMRKLKSFKTKEPNSMARWWKVKNPFIVIFNFLIIHVCRYLPSLRLKRFLYRLTGMKVGYNVGIGLEATFDIFFPELIELGDDSIIGHNATILAHEFLIGEWRKGKTKIGKRALIGAGSLVLAGVTVGDGSTISAMSLVNDDLPQNSFYGGVPAKRLKRSNSNQVCDERL
ncbi:acyltransferase [Candidatus Micrarchaeota archaeon]|nr:MAG: acyltransferase [Candidatus Micrarchaeota archaeon]